MRNVKIDGIEIPFTDGVNYLEGRIVKKTTLLNPHELKDKEWPRHELVELNHSAMCCSRGRAFFVMNTGDFSPHYLNYKGAWVNGSDFSLQGLGEYAGFKTEQEALETYHRRRNLRFEFGIEEQGDAVHHPLPGAMEPRRPEPKLETPGLDWLTLFLLIFLLALFVFNHTLRHLGP